MLKRLCFLLLLIYLTGLGWADSPLTSTPLWKGYRDLPQVTMARDLERLNTSLALYLLSGASLDKKIAVINALSWNYEGKQNAMLFREVLGQKYKSQDDKVIEGRMTAEERLCLAYLTAMDDYFHVERALAMARQARKRLSQSFTADVITRLIEAQSRFAEQDKLWTLVEPAFTNKQFKPDMRPEGRKQIYDYMILYRKKS